MHELNFSVRLSHTLKNTHVKTSPATIVPSVVCERTLPSGSWESNLPCYTLRPLTVSTREFLSRAAICSLAFPFPAQTEWSLSPIKNKSVLAFASRFVRGRCLAYYCNVKYIALQLYFHAHTHTQKKGRILLFHCLKVTSVQGVGMGVGKVGGGSIPNATLSPP